MLAAEPMLEEITPTMLPRISHDMPQAKKKKKRHEAYLAGELSLISLRIENI